MNKSNSKWTDQQHVIYNNIINEAIKIRETKVPIRKGCPNNGPCNCTGMCQEIVGWRDKHPLER